jgi:hypothetical protein
MRFSENNFKIKTDGNIALSQLYSQLKKIKGGIAGEK